MEEEEEGETAGLPDEVRAVAAERRLLEEPGYEFVVLDFVDVFLPQRPFPSEPVRYVLRGRFDQTYISHVHLKTNQCSRFLVCFFVCFIYILFVLLLFSFFQSV